VDDVILIFDDIRTHEPGKLEWLLHYDGSAQSNGSDLILSNEDARVMVRPLFPERIQIAEKTGLKDHDPDRKVPYLALSPEGIMRETKFVTAVVPMPEADTQCASSIEPLSAENAVGARIRNNRTVTDVWLNLMADGRRMHRNSNNVIDGWDTDAYLIALTRPVDANHADPDSMTRCFMACGSYLRKNTKVVLHSLSKVYAAFTCNGPEMQVALQGQPVTRALIRAVAKPHAVSLNGAPIAPFYDPDRQALQLHP
jgi:hypothetical protein